MTEADRINSALTLMVGGPIEDGPDGVYSQSVGRMELMIDILMDKMVAAREYKPDEVNRYFEDLKQWLVEET